MLRSAKPPVAIDECYRSYLFFPRERTKFVAVASIRQLRTP
jgi:hypothetical protein